MPSADSQVNSAYPDGTLIDIGLNLTHDSFDKDRDEVIQRALDAGVRHMILTGSCVSGSTKALDLAKKHPGTLFSTAGVHPHHVKDCNGDTLDALKQLAQANAVVAIGECGLDFFRNFSPRPAQETWFEKQLELAAALQLPLFLHERDSHETFRGFVKEYRAKLTDVVVHCFTGNREALHDYLDLGCYIGITGWICDERRGQKLQELVREIPLDRLMVETDAPYLLPRDLNPKPKHNRNEPSYLPHVVKTVAHCMGKEIAEVMKAAAENTRRFFRLPVEAD